MLELQYFISDEQLQETKKAITNIEIFDRIISILAVESFAEYNKIHKSTTTLKSLQSNIADYFYEIHSIYVNDSYSDFNLFKTEIILILETLGITLNSKNKNTEIYPTTQVLTSDLTTFKQVKKGRPKSVEKHVYQTMYEENEKFVDISNSVFFKVLFAHDPIAFYLCDTLFKAEKMTDFGSVEIPNGAKYSFQSAYKYTASYLIKINHLRLKSFPKGKISKCTFCILKNNLYEQIIEIQTNCIDRIPLSVEEAMIVYPDLKTSLDFAIECKKKLRVSKIKQLDLLHHEISELDNSILNLQVLLE